MADSRVYEFEGSEPTVDEDARVAADAVLVGDVDVAAEASVWPGAVLRGDVDPVRVGRQTHVGDNATLHATVLEERAMVGHGAVLNEATVEDGALVGFNATIGADVTIGSESVVAAGTVVPGSYDVPPESFVRGVPAEVTPLEETGIDAAAVFEEYASGEYTDLANRHAALFE